MIDEIKKHLKKKNKNMSDQDSQAKAERIWNAYKEPNRKRDQKREEEFKKAWDKALQKENDQWALDVLSGDELLDYFQSGSGDE